MKRENQASTLAAPVALGMMLVLALRPPRQSLLDGPSTVFCVAARSTEFININETHSQCQDSSYILPKNWSLKDTHKKILELLHPAFVVYRWDKISGNPKLIYGLVCFWVPVVACTVVMRPSRIPNLSLITWRHTDQQIRPTMYCPLQLNGITTLIEELLKSIISCRGVKNPSPIHCIPEILLLRSKG